MVWVTVVVAETGTWCLPNLTFKSLYNANDIFSLLMVLNSTAISVVAGLFSGNRMMTYLLSSKNQLMRLPILWWASDEYGMSNIQRPIPGIVETITNTEVR